MMEVMGLGEGESVEKGHGRVRRIQSERLIGVAVMGYDVVLVLIFEREGERRNPLGGCRIRI